jgi:hypothetical protein
MRRLVLLLLLCAYGSIGFAQAPDTELLDRTRTLPGIHTKLIGQDFCVKCHDATQRANDAKCLDCHKEIQGTIDRERGLHFNMVEQSKICESCHKEHQGVEGKLTSWRTEEEMKAFDHKQTDYTLEGSHGKVECRKCHTPQFADPKTTQRVKKEDSFLGLNAECITCHKDVHEKKFDRKCEKCHLIDKWNKLVPDAPIDHGKTDYALKGKHETVACKKCHKTERQIDPIKFSNCSDCHLDTHRGQLATRTDGGRCDACHDVNGFMPATYGLAEHQESKFKLEGAHRAVACNACHKKEMINGELTTRLVIADRECENCHKNPTPGHVVEIAERIKCKDCHSVDKWQQIAFNHDTSKFKLTGAHTKVACVKCHTTENPKTDRERVRYVEMKTGCADCHIDVHRNQFARKQCQDCHTTDDWKPTLFDHQKNSDYALVGKHVDIECARCHKLERGDDGKDFRRYKPIPTDCESCHGRNGTVLRFLYGETYQQGAAGR